MAHKLRSPLTAMSAWLYTLKKGLEPHPELLEDAQAIENEIDRLTNIIADFERTVRLPQPNPVHIELSTIQSELERWFDEHHAQSEVSLSIQFPSEGAFYADIGQSILAVERLIDNAVQATEDVKGDKEPVILTAEEKGDKIVILVTDRGIGITEELQGKMFEPFMSTRQNHSGLGLTLARNILHSNTGELEYEPSVSGGSVFKLIFTKGPSNP